MQIDPKHWVYKLLEIIAKREDEDKVEVARLLIRALKIEFRRIKRIKEIAKILFMLCNLARHSPSRKVAFSL